MTIRRRARAWQPSVVEPTGRARVRAGRFTRPMPPPFPGTPFVGPAPMDIVPGGGALAP